MNRKYLSFLGTNHYITCNYFLEGFSKKRDIRFIQEATVSWFCSDWDKNDEIVIFTTEEAFYKNWQDGADNNYDDNKGLSSALRDLQLKAQIKRVNIPLGKDTEEIWRLFQIIYDVIDEDDQLYLDITHAFRSLPLLSLVVLNYAKVMKHISVKAILYGAMEALGTAFKVKTMPMEDRNVPVFDLLAFDELLDWSIAIDRFVETGDASLINKIAIDSVKPILAQTKGKDADAAAIRLFVKAMKDLSDSIATCRSRAIPQKSLAVKKAYEKAKGQQQIKPLQPLLEKIKEKIKDFSGDEILDGITATRWCISNGLIQQGITIFLETFVSYVIRSAHIGDYHDQTKRILVTQALNIKKRGIPKKDWLQPSSDEPETVKALIQWFNSNPEIEKCFSSLNKPRNDINHAGQRDDSLAPEKLKMCLEKNLKRFCSAKGS